MHLEAMDQLNVKNSVLVFFKNYRLARLMIFGRAGSTVNHAQMNERPPDQRREDSEHHEKIDKNNRYRCSSPPRAQQANSIIALNFFLGSQVAKRIVNKI
jgi:hypothetical protein